MLAGVLLDGVAPTILLGHPLRRTEEYLPFVLALGDEHAVEADIIDDDAVGQVLNEEGDEILVAVALDPEPGGEALAGSDDEFETCPARVGAWDKRWTAALNSLI